MKNRKTIYPATLLCDFYKISHREQYPEGTEYVYSNWTPRSTYIEGVNEVVAFGMQAFIKRYLIEYFDKHFFNRSREEVITEYVRFIKYTLLVENPDASHIEELHDLGYLPLHIKMVKEGTLVPLRVPMMTIVNTQPKFFWLTNYIETLMSSENWLPSTSATIAFEYKKLLTKYVLLTGGSTDFIPFQGHDFSMRGMVIEAAKLSGAGHLTSFVGTDTIPAIPFLEKYYNANIEKELVGTSVNATEHSVMCAGGQETEYETYERLINKVHPTGILSIVSDTWDLWSVLNNIIGGQLKEDILKRDGKVVIRPDSGDPIKIICGHNIQDLTNYTWVESIQDVEETAKDILREQVNAETPHGEHGVSDIEDIFKFKDKYYKAKVEFFWNRYDKQYYFIDECNLVNFEEYEPTSEEKGVIEILWEIFGGTINEKGFKELDPHIGAIYGDSITLVRAESICKGLMDKGFASTNIVFGIGSFTYQYQTRDTFGFAMKATHVVINGKEKFIQKDPITDTNKTKKSASGRLVVVSPAEEADKSLVMIDHLTIAEQNELVKDDLLEDVFIDGVLLRDQSLSEIREILLSNL